MENRFVKWRKYVFVLSALLTLVFILSQGFRSLVYFALCGFDDLQVYKAETVECRVLTFLFPDNARYHLRLARLLDSNLGDASTRSRKVKESVTEYQNAIGLDNTLDTAYYSLGLKYLNNMDVDTALLMFKKCADLNPAESVYHSALARAYELKGAHSLAARQKKISDTLVLGYDVEIKVGSTCNKTQ